MFQTKYVYVSNAKNKIISAYAGQSIRLNGHARSSMTIYFPKHISGLSIFLFIFDEKFENVARVPASVYFFIGQIWYLFLNKRRTKYGVT